MSGNGPFYGEGLYLVRVVDHGFETSKNGYPMIVFKVEPTHEVRVSLAEGGERQEDREPVSQSWPRTMRLTVVPDNENSVRFAMMKLRFAGFEGERMEDLDLRGATVYANCKHSDYQGKTYEQWELPLPPREDDEVESDPSVAKRLNALFGRQLKSGASAPPAAGPGITDSDSVDAADLPGDDDIPF